MTGGCNVTGESNSCPEQPLDYREDQLGMPKVLELIDARYLNEVGWFIYRERYGENRVGQSYAARSGWREIASEAP